jgi:hypothetical protein
MDRVEADLNAVPSVDRDNHQGEHHLLLLVEVRAQRLIRLIGRTRLGHQCQRFGPTQGGAFPFGIKPSSACGAPLWMKMVAAWAGLSEPLNG